MTVLLDSGQQVHSPREGSSWEGGWLTSFYGNLYCLCGLAFPHFTATTVLLVTYLLPSLIAGLTCLQRLQCE